MPWQQLGLVKPVHAGSSWWRTHAYTPTPLMLDDGTLRVYVAGLDADNVGRVGYMDLDPRLPTNLIAISREPALDIGPDGAFDDNGVTPVSVLRVGSEIWLYYIGWQLSDKVRYLLFVGLAISSDGGETFTRHSSVPVLDRSHDELLVRTAANVVRENGLWRMWYIAGSETVWVEGKQVPTYAMRYLESRDGTMWGKSGTLVMSPHGPDEYGFGRPYVLGRENGAYEMFYSVRSRSRGYHLGYATSSDGTRWLRKDSQAAFRSGPGPWDSEMAAFGAVVDTQDGRWLFYNGNGYGRDGLGVARWVNR